MRPFTRVEHNETSFDKLDRLTLRYRRENVLRNEHYQDLCKRYPAFYQRFQPSFNFHCIFIHRLTSIEMLNHLIEIASQTHFFTIDAQHQLEPYPWAQYCIPALIQIEFLSTNYRTPLVILIEVLYLQTTFILQTRDFIKELKMKQLCQEIFSPSKHIFTWRNARNQLSFFYSYQLFNENDLNHLYFYDIHDYFRQWYPNAFPHSMVHRQRTNNQTYTLQTSLFLVFNEWLNTRMQYASWHCGIDKHLKTYHHHHFSSSTNKNYYWYLRNEIEYRQQMQTYALYNCLAITKLAYHILQQWSLLTIGITIPSSTIIHYKRKKKRQSFV